MKTNYLIVFFVLSLWGIWSCQQPTSEAAPPSHLITDFYVRYLQAERQLKAYSSFFEGDSLPGATPVARENVRVGGMKMVQRHLPKGDIRYTLTRTTDFPEQFQLTYEDAGGDRREYTSALAPVPRFAFEGPVRLGAGATLVVEGAPLQENEELVLLFSSPDNKATSISLTGPSEDNIFRLDSAQLQALTAGPHQLYLVRKKRTTEEQSNGTIHSTLEFYTNTIAVTVVP